MDFKNGKNILGSEIGLITKTITVPGSYASYNTVNGRKIVPAGAVFASPFDGLLFQDVDITDGDKLGSLIIAGHYLRANLPYSITDSQVSAFSAIGLYNFSEGSVVRPSFGTAGLTALSAPVLTSTTSTINIASVSGAINYTVYNASKIALATSTASTYTASTTGTYYVGANGDNITYKNSPLASIAITVG